MPIINTFVLVLEEKEGWVLGGYGLGGGKGGERVIEDNRPSTNIVFIKMWM